MSDTPTVFAMSMTPFLEDGSLDEDGLRVHLRRLRDAGVGVYLGSPGSGEGHALTEEERRRVYEIGVEELRGKVPVRANPPEPRSAQQVIGWMRLALECGVECVECYALDAGHGMKPRPDEQWAFYEDVLTAIDAPVALSIHRAAASWAPSATLIGQLAKKYDNVRSVHVIHAGSETAVRVKDVVPDDVKVYGGTATLLQDLALGLDGCQGAEGNVCPNLMTGIVRDFQSGDIETAGHNMTTLLRLYRLSGRWSPSSARWVKMAMKVLGYPGGDVRRPYLMPGPDQLEAMKAEFDTIGLVEAERAATVVYDAAS